MSVDDLHSLSDFEYPEELPPAALPPQKPPKKSRRERREERREGRRSAENHQAPEADDHATQPATTVPTESPAAKSTGPATEPGKERWYRTRGWRIIGKVAGFLLALLWLVLISGTLILRTFGYEPLVVQTSSMEPTVDAGDLMISTSRTDPVQVGQIYIGIAPDTGLPTAHRVIRSGPDPDCWITKGDNNDAPDNYCLTSAELDRQIVGWVPYGGFVNNFLSQPLVRMLMFAAPLLLFLPPLIRAFRTPKKPEPSGDVDDDAESEEAEEPVGLQIGTVDKVVSILVALAIFGLLGARLYFGYIPVAVGEVAPESALTSGAMAITQEQPIADLEPGDIILIVPPEQVLASLQQVVVQEADPTLLPPEPGNRYLTTADAVAPAGSILNRMQLPEAGQIPQVVFEIPKIGGWLPVLATTTGFAGLMILLGLFATLLVMRVLLSTGNTRNAKARAGNRD